MAEFVTVIDQGRVRWLTMSNPQRMNAVPATGWSELAAAFSAFEESDARVLVLRGEGDNFCSGVDLNRDLGVAPSPSDSAARMRGVSATATALHRLSKPTIAAVDGVAVGAGMNLALGCDITVATERARFAEIFVKRGLTLDFGGTWLLPRLVGLARARELALTGRFVGAEEARTIGLISEVVPVGGFESRVTELADELAAGAPLAQMVIKRAMDRSSSMTFEQALAFEEQAQAMLLGSEDLAEGSSAFVEKRPPEFKGR